MWHKPCRTFHPWCPCIKTRCLLTYVITSCPFDILNRIRYGWKWHIRYMDDCQQYMTSSLVIYCWHSSIYLICHCHPWRILYIRCEVKIRNQSNTDIENSIEQLRFAAIHMTDYRSCHNLNHSWYFPNKHWYDGVFLMFIYVNTHVCVYIKISWSISLFHARKY